MDNTSNELRSQFAPNLSDECKAYIERLLQMDVSVDAIMDTHLDDCVFNDMLKKRDSFVTRKDVINVVTRVHSIRSRKHMHDATNILEWKKQDEANFFFFQQLEGADRPFIMGIQMSWMLDMMPILFVDAHDQPICCLKHYQLYLCLIFDEQQAGVPVAWAMTSRNKIENTQVWLMELQRRAKEKRTDWRIIAFITDYVSAEIHAIDVFECRFILCIWHMRRAWLKNVYKYATKERVMDIFHCLGEIMMAMHESEESTMQELHTFFVEFSDQPCFLEYLYSTWCEGEGCIAMWVKNFKNFSHANQNTNNAIESYHGKLKSLHLRDDKKTCSRRMDNLYFILVCKVEPFYQYKREL
ncbi:hypothetical protein SUGI_0200680 [Cryptomeria japonica]|nr:hypothetical protein SUGI_0200680 [Cryptomeria japonica]